MQKTAYRTRLTALLILSIGHLHSQSPPRDRTDQKSEANKSEYKAATKPETAKSPPAILSGTQPQSANKQSEAPEKSTSVWEKAFAPEYASNWVLAGLACIGAFFTFHTWRALKKQVAANERAAVTAERTLLLTQRADILLDVIKLSSSESIPHSKVILTLRNFGKTRANDVRYNFGYGVIGTTVPHQMASTILGAGAESELWTRHTLLESVGQEQFGQIMTGEVHYRVWGDASYTDVFGQPHYLRFRACFRPPWSFDIEENDASQSQPKDQCMPPAQI